jgi:hypothetical protein
MRARDFMPFFVGIEIDEDGTIKPEKAAQRRSMAAQIDTANGNAAEDAG